MSIKFFAPEKLAIFIASSISLVALYISYTSGIMLAYNDATAHLNTARRIIDNLTPGLVQIGSVWLPLLHLLELPFAMNFFLWQSGLAGAIVSGASFVASCFFLYKLLYLLTGKSLPGFTGICVLATNPNMLYLQTTAMFEPLLMATALASVYFLARWAKNKKANDLIIGAFFTMLATLTRYDGWALFIVATVYVVLVSIVQKRKGTSGTLIIFLSLAGLGVCLWLLYNQLIFSDPLYFATGEFSAKAQQDVLLSRGFLPTRHNIILSTITYSLAVVLNNGILVMFPFVIGLIVYLKKYTLQVIHLAPLLLLVPFAFNVITLYLGESVIWLPMVAPYVKTYFNARYGILMLPAIAFFVGFIAGKRLSAAIPILGLCILQLFLFYEPDVMPIFGNNIGIITLQDTVSSVNNNTNNASKFLHANYDKGLILVSSASADAFIFRSGLPLKNYITEGTGNYWKESLGNPTKFANWIVFFQDKSDRVGRAVGNNPILEKEYLLTYKDTTYQIWKRK